MQHKCCSVEHLTFQLISISFQEELFFKKMIYPQDFRPKPNNNQFNVSASHVIFDSKLESKTIDLGKNTIHRETVWTRYGKNSTLHGIRYLVEPKITANER